MGHRPEDICDRIWRSGFAVAQSHDQHLLVDGARDFGNIAPGDPCGNILERKDRLTDLLREHRILLVKPVKDRVAGRGRGGVEDRANTLNRAIAERLTGLCVQLTTKGKADTRDGFGVNLTREGDGIGDPTAAFGRDFRQQLCRFGHG